MTAPGLKRLEDELRRSKPGAAGRDSRHRRGTQPRRPRKTPNTTPPANANPSSKAGSPNSRNVSAAEVIDPATLSGDHVKFGAQVKLVDEETEKEATYQIVGMHEADIKAALLSISSPLAKALIGKKAGDTISVPAPGGDRSYEILSVRYG